MSKIRVENVSKVFNPHSRNKNQVLKNVSFELPEKGLIAIFGKSGSGKTTLLNIIGGLDKQDTGKIYIDDECTSGKVDKIRNAKIGFIFQNYYLEKGYTISEIMHNQMTIAGFKDEGEIKRRTEAVLKLVEMDRFKNKQGDALSGGQKQRVAIARALIKGSDIILADEPTGNLDAENTTKVMDILKEISKTQLVVIVTHELSLIEKYADNHIKLVDGELVEKEEIEDSIDYSYEDNQIIIDESNKEVETKGDLSIEYYGKPVNGTIKIITNEGNMYLESSDNISIIDSKSEKKLVFENKKENKKDFKNNLEGLKKSNSNKNGKLFNLKNVFKSNSTSEKFYSSANIFKQIFICIMACVICFFSFFIFEIASNQIEHKQINENSSYVKVNSGTYEMIRSLKDDGYSYNNIDYFELEMREGIFSFNNVASLSGIQEKYTPKSIDKNKTYENIFGNMPKEKEVLVSRCLAERLKKDLREEDVQNDKSLLLMTFNSDYKISGIIEDSESAIYMNKKDYINFLGIYSKISFVDKNSLFLSNDYVYNYFSAEIDVVPKNININNNQVRIEINRNSLYKMMSDVSEADKNIDYANNKLVKLTTAISIKNSKPLYVRDFSIVRTAMSTDIKILVTEDVLDDIFVNICPLTATDSYFKIDTKNSEDMNKLLNSVSGGIPTENIKEIYDYQNSNSISNSYGVLMIFGLSLILLYLIYFFIEKSGSIKNSKEYGIYRAIGVNRSNLIYKETVISFINNIISYLVFGLIVSILIVSRYAVMNHQFGGFVLLNLGMFTASSLLMIGISLIPYLFVLYKTPAQILAGYDI